MVPSPRFHAEGFIDKLIHIIEKEQIDIVIPTFEEIFCFSKQLHRFPKFCRIFSASYEKLDHLHNKWLFNDKLHKMGITAPKSELIKTEEDLLQINLSYPFILKPCYSRAAQKVVKINSPQELKKVSIDPNNPWVAQEWIAGKKLCSYSVASEGKLKAHTTYPLEFSIDDSSCLNFEAIEHVGIKKWVKTFIEKENFTGQFGFDFIELEDGTLYPIECNPRSTSGLHLFQEEDNLPEAFFNESAALISPKPGFCKQIAVGMLLYGWKAKHPEKTYFQFFKKLLSVQDVIFSRKDLYPFIAQPFLFITYIIRSLKLRMRIVSMFTFDTDWNGEAQAEEEQAEPKSPLKAGHK